MAEQGDGFFKDEQGGGRTVATMEELVEAVLQWWGYDQMEESPFPSREPPPQAARKWYEQHLGLEVKGPNHFEWTCPGCRQRVEARTNYLHTCLMFDYEYWQFCPRCSNVLDSDEEEK